MAITEMDKWEKRADLEAKRLFAEVRQRGEKQLTVRVRCPGCNGRGVTPATESGSAPTGCPVCAGIGMAAYDWTRSDEPRPLRPSERRTEEVERASKVVASLERLTDKFAPK